MTLKNLNLNYNELEDSHDFDIIPSTSYTMSSISSFKMVKYNKK